MNYLIYLLIIIFPFGQLLRLPLSGNEVVLHFNDVVVGLIVFFWIYPRLPHIRKIFSRHSRMTTVISIWVGVAVVSLAINISQFSFREIVISSLYVWRFIAYSLLFFIVRELGKAQRTRVSRLLLLAILVVSLAGLLQYIFLPDVTFLSADNWDDHYYRLISTFLDPGFTGAILVLGLVYGFQQLTSGLSRWLYLGTVYLAMALTYSRAAYLMFIVVSAVAAISKKSMRLFILCTLLLALTIVLLPKTAGEGTKLQRENSVLARIRNWEQSIFLWKDQPILGFGFNTYRYVLSQKGLITEEGVKNSHAGGGADSSLLLVLVTTGIIGLAAYLNMGKEIFQKHRKSVLVMSSFAGVLVNSWFNNTLFYPWVMEWLWILLAVS